MGTDRLGRVQIFHDPQNPGQSDGGQTGVRQGNAGRWLSSWATATLGQKHLTHGQSEVGLPQVIQGLGVARGKKNKIRSSQKTTYRGWIVTGLGGKEVPQLRIKEIS